MTDADLIRFVNAQTDVNGKVIEELTDGCKRTHWMWFIFPQLAGLGHSPLAQRYAIRDLNQARRYLADPMLGSRLRNDVGLMMRHKGKSGLEILGFLDDLKFRSCLTLFAQAEREIGSAGYSTKPWINSMVASRTLAYWSFYIPDELAGFP